MKLIFIRQPLLVISCFFIATLSTVQTSFAQTADASTKPVCSQCGTVISVTAKKTKDKGRWLSEVGAPSSEGKPPATVTGATGGTTTGADAQKRMKLKNVYQIAVQMDDGSSRYLLKEFRPAIQPGDKVKVLGEDIFIR